LNWSRLGELKGEWVGLLVSLRALILESDGDMFQDIRARHKCMLPHMGRWIQQLLRAS